MQHKANFLNNSLFSLLLLGLLSITSCNTAMRLNAGEEEDNAPKAQPRVLSIDFEEKKEPALGDTPDDNIEKIVELMKGEGTHVGTGSTALHYLALSDEVCSSSDYKQIVRLLVNQRADINVKDNGGWTPLHIAVYNKNYALVKALISRGADVTIKDSIGRTAYAIAKENKDQDTMDLLYMREKLHREIMALAPCLKEIKRLIREGVLDPESCRALEKELHHAVGKQEPALDDIRFLISIGVDINSIGGIARRRTALGKAAEAGKLNLVEELINLGADVNKAEDRTGRTPLHLAVDECNAEVVAFLLRSGADANQTNHQNMTPLQCLRASETEWGADNCTRAIADMLTAAQ